MSQRGHTYREIRDVLQVSLGFVTDCCQRYQEQGVEGLKLNYWGTQGYLKPNQKEELMAWLAQKDAWLLEEVAVHIEDAYGVVYQSPPELLHATEASRIQLEKVTLNPPG
ncbi:MAG: hypothetical protein HC833_18725 [Leptolyngbyaceae cyanobacterium RM1_406_9]|nr:hypothetical protein [Leptolyngbyaceae cyanobacterium RM1_406_9]